MWISYATVILINLNVDFFYITVFRINLNVLICFKGEEGQCVMDIFEDLSSAEESFAARFRAKTGNKWSDRSNFVPKKNKYILLQMGEIAGKKNKFWNMIPNLVFYQS